MKAFLAASVVAMAAVMGTVEAVVPAGLQRLGVTEEQLRRVPKKVVEQLTKRVKDTVADETVDGEALKRVKFYNGETVGTPLTKELEELMAATMPEDLDAPKDGGDDEEEEEEDDGGDQTALLETAAMYTPSLQAKNDPNYDVLRKEAHQHWLHNGGWKGCPTNYHFVRNENQQNVLQSYDLGSWTYDVDARGRVTSASGTAGGSNPDAETNTHVQALVRANGRSHDEAGHILAKSLGGSNCPENFWPQNAVSNQHGHWKKAERDATWFRDNCEDVDMHITFVYDDNGAFPKRPVGGQYSIFASGGKLEAARKALQDRLKATQRKIRDLKKELAKGHRISKIPQRLNHEKKVEARLQAKLDAQQLQRPRATQHARCTTQVNRTFKNTLLPEDE